MIDGLKLTMTGEEIRRLLRRRIAKNEAHTAEWRAERLAFIREHVDPSEVYRLGSNDLKFGELLPPQPESVASWG